MLADQSLIELCHSVWKVDRCVGNTRPSPQPVREQETILIGRTGLNLRPSCNAPHFSVCALNMFGQRP
jgi:hypothetical protein